MIASNEFGVERSLCGCSGCQAKCRFMPGFLVPADLDRMIPAGADPFRWAESNLLASPGALTTADGEMFWIPTLVPAIKGGDRSCIHLRPDGQCGIDAVAPFGCALLSCGPEVPGLFQNGLLTICSAPDNGLYKLLLLHLSRAGKTQPGY